MSDSEHIQKAKAALNDAGKNLQNPSRGGSPETAVATALIGIGHALVAIAEGDPPPPEPSRKLHVH